MKDKPEAFGSLPSARPTYLDLEPIKKREAKASKGPWTYEFMEIHERARAVDGPTETHRVVDAAVAGSDVYQKFGRYVCGVASTRGKYEREEANGIFIAHAREDVPALIAEVESLRAAALASSRGPQEKEENRSAPRYTHGLERTSPKGGPFLGRCRYCKAENLPMKAALEPCEAAPTQDEQVIDALTYWDRPENQPTPPAPLASRGPTPDPLDMEYRSGSNESESACTPTYPLFRNGVSLLWLFKEAAADEELTDREVRNIVLYLSDQPITIQDIQRTRELARQFGWAMTDECNTENSHETGTLADSGRIDMARTRGAGVDGSGRTTTKESQGDKEATLHYQAGYAAGYSRARTDAEQLAASRGSVTRPPEPQGWQPIETIPKDKAVLLWTGWSYQLGHFNTVLGHLVAGWDHRALAATHWTDLLPAPPSSGAAKKEKV